MSATISAVRPLAAIDKQHRELRDENGNRVLSTKESADIVHYRQRWRVRGEKNDRTLLIPADRATLARSVHDELTQAHRNGTPVGADGWPVGSVRPNPTRPSTPLTGHTDVGATVGPYPRILGPDATLTFFEFYTTRIQPIRCAGSLGNNVATMRSQARFVDAHLRRHPDGRRLAMWEITSSDLTDVRAKRTATGRGGPASESSMDKFDLVVSQVFTFAADSQPAAVLANPWLAVKSATTGRGHRARRPNRMDPDVSVEEIATRTPTYRDARREIDVWEFLDDLWDVWRPGAVRNALFARLGSGLRPCELIALEAEGIDLDALVVKPHLSLTLQQPGDNGGIRLFERDELKEGEPERRVLIISHPRVLQAFEEALATRETRATLRRSALESGQRRSRSTGADAERWLASELRFADRCKVFTGDEGAPLDMTNVDRVWTTTLEQMYPDPSDPRRELRMYDLRALYENTLVDLGVPPAVVAGMTGHSEIVQQRHYREQTDKAVADARLTVQSALETRSSLGGHGDSSADHVSTNVASAPHKDQVADRDTSEIIDIDEFRRRRAGTAAR